MFLIKKQYPFQTNELLRFHYKMAASKPTCWLSRLNNFLYHWIYALEPQRSIWAVSLSTLDLSAQSLILEFYKQVLGVSLDLVRLWATLTQRVLYPLITNSRLYLNKFRRKPAISEFDWLFTPNHKSSPSIATDVGSVLQNVLSIFQPVHDQITRFRVK